MLHPAAVPVAPNDPADLIARLEERHPELAKRIRKQIPESHQTAFSTVAAASEFVCRTLTRNPVFFEKLVKENFLSGKFPDPRTAVANALSSCDSDMMVGMRLRNIRNLWMVAIAYRDISGDFGLFETMSHLSDLAEAVVDESARWFHRELAKLHGEPVDGKGNPQSLVVIAMGKLGARELNFSSDIDLVFAYPEPGETTGERPITNEEFFGKLARKMVALFKTSAGNPLFRMDLRLRPFGDTGPIVMHFDSMEFYYQTQGREWERYALIKCRAISGNRKHADCLFKRLTPFVFRRYLDYGVFDSLREMKHSIMAEVRRKGTESNIKTGIGGIREVEFFGQTFQLLRGGVLPPLQDRAILNILPCLKSHNFIDDRTLDELIRAYCFLRHVEHRIQAWDDRQTHKLPEDADARQALFTTMGYESWDAFLHDLSAHRDRVHAHFRTILETEEPPKKEPEILATVWSDTEGPMETRMEILETAGFSDPRQVAQRLSAFREDKVTKALSLEGRKRLDRLIPKLLEKSAASGSPDLAFNRILDLVKSIQRRINYLSLFLENPQAIVQLVRLATASPWVMDFLSRHPVLLDELLDHRTLYSPPGKSALIPELSRRMDRIDAEDLEAQIETLCIFKQVNQLRVAAADVTGEFPLMKVSDRLTEIAECVLEDVMDRCRCHLAERHGRPTDPEGRPIPGRGFVVIGYGKLGGIELGYGSDLDIVFLHGDTDGTTEGPERPIPSSQFFTRLGQRVIHSLKAHTRAGTLYEPDLRLRPDGNSGILVSSMSVFEHYQKAQAWTWEHQAMVRARPICGDPELADTFNAIRKEVLCLKRDPESLRCDILEMREKMRAAHPVEEAGIFDLKQGRGGMVDIEFMVQYLVLAHAHRKPELTRWPDNIRILETISETGVLPAGQATFLRTAYLLIRSAVHKQSLKHLPARIPESAFALTRKRVSLIWDEVMHPGA